MMRIYGLLVILSACSTTPLGEPVPDSVHARLAAPTRLLVAPAASRGAITVGHYVDGAWQRTRVALPIETGAITATLDARDRLVVTELGLGFAPLALPTANATPLTHVRLALDAPATATTTWRDADSARATTSLALALSWELTVDGASSPLSDQAFPAVPLALALDGDGASVAGALTIDAPGKLWSWASLVELDDLSLTLSAATTD